MWAQVLMLFFFFVRRPASFRAIFFFLVKTRQSFQRSHFLLCILCAVISPQNLNSVCARILPRVHVLSTPCSRNNIRQTFHTCLCCWQSKHIRSKTCSTLFASPCLRSACVKHTRNNIRLNLPRKAYPSKICSAF